MASPIRWLSGCATQCARKTFARMGMKDEETVALGCRRPHFGKGPMERGVLS